MDYNKISLEECFVYYHTGKTACECNADEKEVMFCKEEYMEEIKFGELFRTKRGNIFKLDGYWLFNDKYKEIDIVKHSSNPINILKLGDFICTDYGWGWYHHKVDEEKIVIDYGDEFIEVKKDEIHRILTQEILWNNSYEVGD